MVSRWFEAPLVVEAGRSFEHDEGLSGIVSCPQCGSDQSGAHTLPLMCGQDG